MLTLTEGLASLPVLGGGTQPLLPVWGDAAQLKKEGAGTLPHGG